MDEHYAEIIKTVAEEVQDMSPKVNAVHQAVFDRDNRNRMQTLWEVVFGVMGDNGLKREVAGLNVRLKDVEDFIAKAKFAVFIAGILGTFVGSVVSQLVIPLFKAFFK